MNKEKSVLVVGSGGREHAIVRALERDPTLEVHCIPGNPGKNSVWKSRYKTLDHNYDEMRRLADEVAKRAIDLTVVGPERLLKNGIVDLFNRYGLNVFGPTQYAMMMTEGSKSACKKLLRKIGVPTPGFLAFADVEPAYEYLSHCSFPIVIKADGLAQGKGVTIAHTLQQAREAVRHTMGDPHSTHARAAVVIEDYIQGYECSYIVITDGINAIPLLPAHDYKRLSGDPESPMTGGMGSFAPCALSPLMHQRIMHTIVYPTLMALRTRNVIYRGALYFGLMLTLKGPHVLELNARFGDPETQAILPLMKSPLYPLLFAAAQGSVRDERIEWTENHAVSIVLTDGFYPAHHSNGQKITGAVDTLEPNSHVFHAGTGFNRRGELIVKKGRVLNITGIGASLDIARSNAYERASRIQFDHKYAREDIASPEKNALQFLSH